MPTLCVIDVQPCFKATLPILPKVLREIERAKQANDGIVVLEYGRQISRTYEEVRSALKKYQRKALSFKHSDDGSIHFIEAAKDKGFDLETVRVVGVNTGYCVFFTVKGFLWSDRIKKVEIVLDAINGNQQEQELASLIDATTSFHDKVKFV